ncbi:MAG: DUF1565 domain-containing protein, partial [Bacteroidota bacterium]
MRTYLPLLLLLYLSVQASATDYYVAKTGDDNNPGTEEAPFLTIGKAASVLVAGDVCYVRAGVYREMLQTANAGTANAPIIFRAYDGEAVTISATEVITDWREDGDGRWSATVTMNRDRGNMLYLDGEPLDQARWPNNTDGNPFTIDAMTVTSGAADRIDATELPAGVDLTGGYVWYLG